MNSKMSSLRALWVVVVLAVHVEARGSEKVAFFKDFLESPPPIQRLIYEDPSEDPSKSETWLFRYQDNAFLAVLFLDEDALELFKEGTRLHPMGPPLSTDAVGVFGDHAWLIDDRQFYESKVPIVKADSQPTQRLSDRKEMLFSEAVQGGLQGIEIGAIQWQGDSFSVTNNWGVVSECELSVSNGVPDALVCERTTSEGLRFNYRYRYEGNILDGNRYYPERIVVRGSEKDGEWSREFERKLRELVLADGRLGKKWFEPAPWLHNELSRHRLIEADGGTFSESIGEYLERSQQYQRVFMFVAAAALIVAGGLVLVMVKKKRKA